MLGIWGAAIATTLIMGVAFGVVLWRFAPRGHVRMLALALVLQLPMSALTYYLVRQPIIGLLQPMFGQSTIYHWAQFLYAPLTEEPAKLWPALLPFFARRIDRSTLAWYGLALGTGFAIGEAWFVADYLVRAGRYVDYPWWEFGGFIGERVMVATLHSALVATTLRGWRCWRGGLALGLATAMLMHLISNLPIGIFPLILPASITAIVMSLFTLTVCVGGALLLRYYAGADVTTGFGPDFTCPKCHVTSKPSLFAVNLGFKSYQRCPACRQWSLT